jgi:hypothetical protein
MGIDQHFSQFRAVKIAGEAGTPKSGPTMMLPSRLEFAGIAPTSDSPDSQSAWRDSPALIRDVTQEGASCVGNRENKLPSRRTKTVAADSS